MHSLQPVLSRCAWSRTLAQQSLRASGRSNSLRGTGDRAEARDPGFGRVAVFATRSDAELARYSERRRLAQSENKASASLSLGGPCKTSCSTKSPVPGQALVR